MYIIFYQKWYLDRGYHLTFEKNVNIFDEVDTYDCSI